MNDCQYEIHVIFVLTCSFFMNIDVLHLFHPNIFVKYENKFAMNDFQYKIHVIFVLTCSFFMNIDVLHLFK